MGSTLVTGATGFTGSHLCRRLVAEGHRVVALVRPTSRTEPLEQIGVECLRVDICDRQALRAVPQDVDTIFHIAAAYRTEHADLSVFERVNVGATENLLSLALERGVQRFVHCSTVGVQGHIEDPPATEDYRLHPGDHYQRSKLEGELLARSYAEKGLSVTVVRPVGIYGPGDLRFLKLFRPIARGRFVMIGSGQVLYHLTYIDDLVEGFLLAARSPAAPGKVFTIAGPRYTTLRELVNLIADAVGRPHPRWRIPYGPVYAAAVVCERLCRPLGVAPPLFPRRVEFFALDRAFDTSKARTLLGYEPRVDLEEGLARTAAWYREQSLI